jgi:hypothetical protein
MSTWVERARPFVEAVDKALPVDATLAQARKALRAAGSGFHGGTYWGRKAWGRAGREMLVRRKLIEGVAAAKTGDVARMVEAEARGDITFPFRSPGPGTS